VLHALWFGDGIARPVETEFQVVCVLHVLRFEDGTVKLVESEVHVKAGWRYFEGHEYDE
jgi:hypothetical protein